MIAYSYFPVVIEFTEPPTLIHPSPTEGVNYCKYLLVRNPEELPLGKAFKIIATRVWEQTQYAQNNN